MLPSGTPMPSLEGATRWLHGEPTQESLRGAPVVVQFWAVSCSLCKEHQPALQALKRTYGPRGVRFVSVHMPRQETDTRVDQVEAAVEALGIEEPVAIDNEHAIGERFQTDGLWPVYFLFDETGKLRARAAGAAGPQAIERVLCRLVTGEGG